MRDGTRGKAQAHKPLFESAIRRAFQEAPEIRNPARTWDGKIFNKPLWKNTAVKMQFCKMQQQSLSRCRARLEATRLQWIKYKKYGKQIE